MKKRKPLKLLIIITLILMIIPLAVLAAAGLPFLLLAIGIALEPDPPKPEITYGEFPFRLEYELNGERMVIEDTLICEYDGIGANEGTGKYRKWKQRLASGNERVTLLKLDETSEIIYDPGSARYYMGDLAEYESHAHSFPDAELYDSEGQYVKVVWADELLEEYGIRLVNWEYTPPIVNRFPDS